VFLASKQREEIRVKKSSEVSGHYLDVKKPRRWMDGNARKCIVIHSKKMSTKKFEVIKKSQ